MVVRGFVNCDLLGSIGDAVMTIFLVCGWILFQGAIA